MLNSTLQSPWEQRNKSRPKYLNSPYGSNSFEEGKNGEQEEKMSYGRTSMPSSNGGGIELPNLKVPQV